MSEPKKLYRVRDHRVIAGVCGGVAKYFNLDPTLVRVIAVALIPLTSGVIIPVYLAAWLLIPEEDTQITGLDTVLAKSAEYKQRRDARTATTQPASPSETADQEIFDPYREDDH